MGRGGGADRGLLNDYSLQAFTQISSGPEYAGRRVAGRDQVVEELKKNKLYDHIGSDLAATVPARTAQPLAAAQHQAALDDVAHLRRPADQLVQRCAVFDRGNADRARGLRLRCEEHRVGDADDAGLVLLVIDGEPARPGS